jgi:hypothetical protein
MSDPVRGGEPPARPTREPGRVGHGALEEQAGVEGAHAGEHPHAGEHHGLEHGALLGPIDWPFWAAAIVGVGAGLAVIIGLYFATSL